MDPTTLRDQLLAYVRQELELQASAATHPTTGTPGIWVELRGGEVMLVMVGKPVRPDHGRPCTAEEVAQLEAEASAERLARVARVTAWARTERRSTASAPGKAGLLTAELQVRAPRL